MKSYVPTIDELKAKAPKELQAIFRKAAEEAMQTATRDQDQIAAAKATMEAVRRCLIGPHGRT